jgi:hypothetical protein
MILLHKIWVAACESTEDSKTSNKAGNKNKKRKKGWQYVNPHRLQNQQQKQEKNWVAERKST